MLKCLTAAVIAGVLSTPAVASVTAFPATFRTQMVPTNGTELFVRVGGQGPAVVLLHGFADTGDMWAPLAALLAKDHTVIVPDLRGMGWSAHPDTGYTKKNQALDIAGVMDAFKVTKADLVTGSNHEFRRHERHQRHRSQFRPLDHGGEPPGHHQAGHGFSEQVRHAII